jgi:hypothetical protein
MFCRARHGDFRLRRLQNNSQTRKCNWVDVLPGFTFGVRVIDSNSRAFETASDWRVRSIFALQNWSCGEPLRYEKAFPRASDIFFDVRCDSFEQLGLALAPLCLSQ